jgi:hypothetical protein
MPDEEGAGRRAGSPFADRMNEIYRYVASRTL